MSSATNTPTTYALTVTGMTCSHCVQAIHEEVSAIPGVEQVQVDLPTGALTVQACRELSRSEIAAAVDEAGYQLA
jgi:copper chaperone CopZ